MRAIVLVVLGLSFASGAPAVARTRNVAIVVYDGVELLDFAGPAEVFAASARRGAAGEEPWFHVYTVAPTTAPIVAQGFVTVTPQHGIVTAPKPDIIVIPGGGSSALTKDAAFMAWLGERSRETEIVLTVCTGAFVAGKAGLLDGRAATTHWGSIDDLRSSTPKAEVVDHRRFVDAGPVVTTAGVSAGIDGSLHVVARLLGRATAEGVARYMEYRWEPDATEASRYDWLNPQLTERGHALQQADLLQQVGRSDEAIAQLERLTKDAPDGASG